MWPICNLGVYDNDGSDMHTPGYTQGQMSEGSGSKHSSPLSPQGLYSGILQKPPSLEVMNDLDIDTNENTNDVDHDDDDDSRDDQNLENDSEELREIIGYRENDNEQVDNDDDRMDIESSPYTGALFIWKTPHVDVLYTYKCIYLYILYVYRRLHSFYQYSCIYSAVSSTLPP